MGPVRTRDTSTQVRFQRGETYTYRVLGCVPSVWMPFYEDSLGSYAMLRLRLERLPLLQVEVVGVVLQLLSKGNADCVIVSVS